VGMEGEAEGKERTDSCSTEESGLESGPPSTSCPSPPTPPLPSSEPESETSDYPRLSPSPVSDSETPVLLSLLTRRTTSLPDLAPRLQVSLVKLAPDLLPGLRHVRRQHVAKKVKLETATGHKQESVKSEDPKCNLSVTMTSDPGVRLQGDRTTRLKLIKQEDETGSDTKLQDMKLEIAKFDSILHGNLLLDQSKHKISDILLLDSLKSRVNLDFSRDSLAQLTTYTSNAISSDSSINLVCQHRPRERSENNGTVTSKSIVSSEESLALQEVMTCKWEGCVDRLESRHLLDHLTSLHVSEAVSCRWAGCKVFGAVSSSCRWLSHHVTSHVGSKPFLCIVDGCRQRFGTQVSLSRHVNSHFKPPCAPPNLTIQAKRTQDTPVKFFVKKTRRKASSRSSPAGPGLGSKLGSDLFDIGVMAGVKDGLARLKPRTRGAQGSMADGVTFDRTGQAVILHSRVNSRRLDASGNIHYLISWFPQGMLSDEWVPGENYRSRRKVPIYQLGPCSRDMVEEHIFGARTRRKQARKPEQSPGPYPLT
jgi:hypothetical protein